MNEVVKLICREETIDKIQRKINLLGINSNINVYTFMSYRILLTFVVFMISLFHIKFGYIIAPIISYVFYQVFPNMYFSPKIKKRKKMIEYDSIYFFEILALSIESGNTLINAIEVTSDSVNSSIGIEFREVIREIKLGKNLDEALNDLKKRIPSDTVNNIILNIRESNLFGNNVLDTLYNQIDYIRERIVLESRAIISKMPLKISVVSVIIFLPLLLTIVLGPIILKFLGI